jgi:O-6-methylguanine DNA methyltransferase
MTDELRDLVKPLRVEVLVHGSPVGPLTLVATARGVARLLLPGAPLEHALAPFLRRHPDLELVRVAGPTPWLEPAFAAVAQALGGRDPELPALDIDVTDFERAVLSAISKIPRGETRSYQQIATGIGRPQASRAVGQACSGNPLPILIPCHRVLGHSGGLTGFAGGTELKVQLLAREGVLLT